MSGTAPARGPAVSQHGADRGHDQAADRAQHRPQGPGQHRHVRYQPDRGGADDRQHEPDRSEHPQRCTDRSRGRNGRGQDRHRGHRNGRPPGMAGDGEGREHDDHRSRGRERGEPQRNLRRAPRSRRGHQCTGQCGQDGTLLRRQHRTQGPADHQTRRRVQHRPPHRGSPGRGEPPAPTLRGGGRHRRARPIIRAPGHVGAATAAAVRSAHPMPAVFLAVLGDMRQSSTTPNLATTPIGDGVPTARRACTTRPPAHPHQSAAPGVRREEVDERWSSEGYGTCAGRAQRLRGAVHVPAHLGR